MREVNVWVTEKNYELPVTEITPMRYDELVNHRVFDTLQDVKYTLLALSTSRGAIDRGLGCPRDVRRAIEHIESLATY